MKGYSFDERARSVLTAAREEAAALDHEYIGTEHILLGMLASGGGTAIEILENLGVNLAGLRETVLDIVKRGRAGTRFGPDLPFTSRAKKVLDEAMSEAMELHHSYVGSEHLLLGLLREEKGIAAQLLNDAGVTVEDARQKMLELLGTEPAKPRFHTSAWGSPTATAAAENPVVPQYADRIRLVLAAAYDVARRQKSAELTMVHTAIALLEHGRGAANTALDRLDFRRDHAIDALIELSTHGTVAAESVDVLTLNSELTTLLQSVDARHHARGTPPGTHHLLLGIMAAAPDVAEIFAAQRVTAETLRDAVNRVSG